MIARTILYDLPIGCKGYICKDPYSGESIVVLNAKYTYETNLKTYLHEAAHDANEDVDSLQDVNLLEDIRHPK
nr:MAG TPA: hypothetical protein [Caudoviricetes sp.]